MSFEITIDKNFDGVKPKNFLKKKLDVPFYKIPKLIKDKRITINRKKIKKDDVLKTGDILKIWPNDITLRENQTTSTKFQEKKDLKIETIFENEDFLVLNKKAGVVVQGAQDSNESLSLHLSFLKDKNQDNSNFNYFHVHRLDKDTSGILVIAKNQIALRNLNEIFRNREIFKKYLCLVVGKPKQKSGEIKVYMKRNEQGIREKMSICKKENKDSKLSISNYKIIKTFIAKDEEFTLLEIEIKTGLMHQIRVHTKYLNCPIVADKMYGNSFIKTKFSSMLNRQFLHAKSISFEFNGKKYDFEAPLTKDLEEFLKYLKY